MPVGGSKKNEKNDFSEKRRDEPSHSTELRRVPSRMSNNLSKSLYYGDAAFCEKWPTSTSKSSSGRGAVLYGINEKDENFKFSATPKEIPSRGRKLQQQLIRRGGAC